MESVAEIKDINYAIEKIGSRVNNSILAGALYPEYS
jgi:hypothetical protein